MYYSNNLYFNKLDTWRWLKMFGESDNTKNDINTREILEQLNLLNKQFENITEYSKRELKGISILSMNPFMKRFFTADLEKNVDYIDNKKHLNRKYEKTLKELHRNTTNALGSYQLVKILLAGGNDNRKFLNMMKRM